MKSFIMMVTICLMLTIGSGCLPLLDSTQIQALAEKTTLLSDKMDNYQAVMSDVVDLIEADKLISEEFADEVDKINEEIDRVQPQMVAVAEAIKNADYISGDDVANAIKAAKAGTVASAVWNPYATPIMLGLSLLEYILILLWKKEKKKLAKTNEGISKFEGVSEPEIASKLHDIVKAKTANI